MKSNRTLLILSLLIFVLGIALLIWAVTAGNKAVIIIEWSTASELDTVGFNIYRSDNPDGPNELINASFIPSSSDPMTGGDYQYEDTSVESGKFYYYWLEDIETNGSTTQHGPIEVKAESEGKPALISGIVMVVMGVVGFILTFNKKKNVNIPEGG